MRAALLVICAGLASGCFTAGGIGVGWRLDHVHNTRGIAVDELSAVEPGERVALQYDNLLHRGTLRGVESSAVLLQPAEGPSLSVPLDRVQAARYDRRRKSGRLLGGIVGFGIDVTLLAIAVKNVAFFPD